MYRYIRARLRTPKPQVGGARVFGVLLLCMSISMSIYM